LTNLPGLLFAYMIAHSIDHHINHQIVVMPAHHMSRYLVREGTNAHNKAEAHPEEDDERGAA